MYRWFYFFGKLAIGHETPVHFQFGRSYLCLGILHVIWGYD